MNICKPDITYQYKIAFDGNEYHHNNYKQLKDSWSKVCEYIENRTGEATLYQRTVFEYENKEQAKIDHENNLKLMPDNKNLLLGNKIITRWIINAEMKG